MVAVGVTLVAIPAAYGEYPTPVVGFGTHSAGPAAPIGPQIPAEPAEALGTQISAIAHHRTAWVVVMLLIAAPLVARRRYPLAMLWLVMGTAVLVSTMTDDRATLRFSFYTCAIAAYSAAVYSPYRVPTLASQLVAPVLYNQLQSSTLPTISNDAVPFLVLVPIAIVADGLRRWRHRADAERARMTVLERQRDEALRRAAEQERARIARELHDVVTHNVSMMVIQAGAARKVMQADQDQARDALLAVEAGGRAAMSELRHVMGLLTMNADGSDQAATAALAPQPGLDQLDMLVAGVRASGVPVDLTVAGQARAMSPGIELTAYRVVQEALTNTVKHAAGASATVVIEYGAGHLRVEIADTGGAPGPSAATGNGRGLIGLRERLAVYGGALHTGAGPGGGYRVAAQIPLDDIH